MNAIIFDLDGTLWETIERTWISTNEIVSKYPFLKEISKDTIRTSMGTNIEECATLYMPYLDKKQRVEILLEMIKWNVKNLEIYGGNVYPKLEETLSYLKKNYILAIVSNCGEGYIEAFLHTSYLDKYFTDYIAAGAEKISKDCAITEIIKRNNIKKAVYVGDTNKDYQACLKANIPFIHAKYGFENTLNVKYSINNLQELPQLISNMNL